MKIAVPLLVNKILILILKKTIAPNPNKNQVIQVVPINRIKKIPAIQIHKIPKIPHQLKNQTKTPFPQINFLFPHIITHSKKPIQFNQFNKKLIK